MNLLERISQEMKLNFTGCLNKNPKQNRVARPVKTVPTKLKITSKDPGQLILFM